MQLEDDALDPEPGIFVAIGRPHVNGPLVRFVILRTFTQPEGERSHNETFAQFLRFIALHRSAARRHQRRRAGQRARRRRGSSLIITGRAFTRSPPRLTGSGHARAIDIFKPWRANTRGSSDNAPANVLTVPPPRRRASRATSSLHPGGRARLMEGASPAQATAPPCCRSAAPRPRSPRPAACGGPCCAR